MRNDTGNAALVRLMIVVSAAIWAACGVLFGVLVWFSVVPASLTSLVLPETIPASVWHAVTPWQVVVPILFTLALAGGVGVFATLVLGDRASQPPRGVTGFFALWFCVVAAAFVVNLAWSIGSAFAIWPPPSISFLFNGASSVISGGYWGIAWGWLPALVVMLVARSRPPRVVPPPVPGAAQLRPRSRGTLILLLAAVLASVALAVAAPLSENANRVADGGTPAAVVQPPPSPEDVAPTAPPPLVAPGAPAPDAIDPSWCRADQLAVISAPGADGATGHRALGLRATNVSDASCVLDGYPDVAFGDQYGSVLSVQFEHGGSFMTDDPGAQPITLQPGASAEAALGWDAMSTGPDYKSAVSIYVAAYPGAARSVAPVSVDIVEEGSVSVTAWGLAAAG